MTLLEIFVIAALATYRWTLMLNNESGPAHIFVRFRTRVGVKFDTYSNPIATNWVAEGVLCPFCLSVWVGIAATLLLAFTAVLGHVEIGVCVLFPFALSGVTVYLKKAVG
jgi:hypothetical protein